MYNYNLQSNVVIINLNYKPGVNRFLFYNSSADNNS